MYPKLNANIKILLLIYNMILIVIKFILLVIRQSVKYLIKIIVKKK